MINVTRRGAPAYGVYDVGGRMAANVMRHAGLSTAVITDKSMFIALRCNWQLGKIML